MATDNIKNYSLFGNSKDNDRIKIYSEKNKFEPVSITLGTLKDQIFDSANVSQLLYKEVDISSTEILNLGGTPIELLSGLTAPEYYTIDKIILEYTEGTTSYSFGNYISLFYGGSSIANIKKELIDNSENSIVCLSLSLPTQVTAADTSISPSFFQGTGLFIGTLDSSDPTGGNGTIKAKIWYTIQTFG